MKMISRVALALALLSAAVGTTTLHANTFDRYAPQVVASGPEGGPTVRILNDHSFDVMVYVVDSHHHRHLLGRVNHSEWKDLQIPSGSVQGTGTIQLKVYPALTMHSLGVTSFEPAGIKTREFSIQSDQVILLYLEADLTRSRAGIVSS